MNKVMTLTQVAVYVSIELRTLRRMIDDGRFSVSPIKGTSPRLWLTTNVDKWLEGGE